MFALDRCVRTVIFALIFITQISINVPTVCCEQLNVSTTEEYGPKNITKSEKMESYRKKIWLVPLPKVKPRSESREWECCPPQFAQLEDQLVDCYNLQQKILNSPSSPPYLRHLLELEVSRNSHRHLDGPTFRCDVFIPANYSALVGSTGHTRQTQCLPDLVMQDGRPYTCHFFLKNTTRNGIQSLLSQKPCPQNQESLDGVCKLKSNQ